MSMLRVVEAGANRVDRDAITRVLKTLGMGPVKVEFDFEWPSPPMSALRSYCREMLATVFVKRANTKSFAVWLVEVGEDRDILPDHLHNLYEEWCCIERVRPLKRRALENDLQKSGFRKSRPRAARNDKQERPTVYTVDRARVCPLKRAA